MEIEKYMELGHILAIGNVNANEINFGNSIRLLEMKKHYQNITVKKYILQETSCFDKRMVNSLKLVHLEEEVLNKKINVLSTSEKVKIELAILLIENVDCIVFNQFDYYFMEKELLFFKKLFKKLVKKYQKTFVFLNSNLSFLFDFADRVVMKKSKKEYVVIDNPTFYEEELYEVIKKPPIVDFVTYLNNNGKKILPYTDLKELLKAIFREV